MMFISWFVLPKIHFLFGGGSKTFFFSWKTFNKLSKRLPAVSKDHLFRKVGTGVENHKTYVIGISTECNNNQIGFRVKFVTFYPTKSDFTTIYYQIRNDFIKARKTIKLINWINLIVASLFEMGFCSRSPISKRMPN